MEKSESKWEFGLKFFETFRLLVNEFGLFKLLVQQTDSTIQSVGQTFVRNLVEITF